MEASNDEQNSEMMVDRQAVIAIVGRPNVGKSTLFNRLIGQRKAVVADEAGTTRDRITHKYLCQDYQTLLVDTGGIEHGNQENIEADVQLQAKLAIQDADLILFLVDVAEELTVNDFAAVDILRKTKKPVIFVANKCDSPGLEDKIYNFFELGFGEPLKVSAIHKLGIDLLEKKICAALLELGFEKVLRDSEGELIEEKSDDLINLCIVGKPNAGKSSLVNALTDSEKVIVSEIAGTTRDPIDTHFSYQEKDFNLIDTAGLRRRGKIEPGIEKFSAIRCFQAIARSDIVVLLIDGHVGITAQDCHIVENALEEKKGLMIVINKIDLFEKGEAKREWILRVLRRRFTFIPWAPVIFVSAKQKRNTFMILEQALKIQDERKKMVHTGEFNAFIQKMVRKHLPASRKIQKPVFNYASQVDVQPPKFVLFFKNAKTMHFSYPRYLENCIREEYGFGGTVIDLVIRSKIMKEKKTGK